jgi:endogenous inhibitor of DNA gyrase (YacG/DUF329 family)
MDREIKCLRCDVQMQYIADHKLQLGQTGWLLGDLPNLLAGALDVSVYACPECGKIEFFQTQSTESESEIAQRKCPRCGKTHDMDYPKCPFCKFSYV